jgi:DNA-binding CsgD family transcriptional regulator
MRGDAETAAAQLRYADRVSSVDEQLRTPGIQIMRGWLAVAHADLPGAIGNFRPAVAGADAVRAHWPLWPCWMALIYQVGSMVADQEFAGSCVDVAEAAAARNPGVASFAGVALQLRGLREHDLEVLAHAVDTIGGSPRPILRGAGHEAYGRALLDAGRRAEGLAELDRAWDEYHAMDARPYRAEVQRTMRAAGVRRAKWSAVTAPPPSGWEALTDAERRVAALIGAGHTNKEVATRLGISVNTVGTHVRAVFAKLGVQSRVQLANQINKRAG